ncbi:ER membrane protein complex subunit 10 [Lingula anatina]|uniref:ER membrane protein complex subunit 10 n=1 Tax=Lingula anatina TaxID=7574 RepID=A0A1S3HTA5_LINAN|nr:ER membrane protein complex subunit 10 [Lingula anatina]|eukprot:XP_013389267.1 ER membrane protein complex subunit 10 [Lingula anatina]
MAAPTSKSLINILFIVLELLSALKSDDEFEGLTSLPVEYAFQTGPDAVFTRKGVISIASLKGNEAHFSQEKALDDEEKNMLKALAQNDDIYRLRVPTKVGQVDGPLSYVSTFMKACALYETRLSETITLNVDTSGNVLGVSTRTYLPYCQYNSVPSSQLSKFNITVEISQTLPGPVPDTQSYIQRMEQEKAEKAKGQQQDNRSFFAKYWMYLVPLFIFLLVSSSQAEEGGR